MGKKTIELIYKTEHVDKMLVYDYTKECWLWDNKYTLRNDRWYTPEGLCVGEITDTDKNTIDLYKRMIEKKTRVNKNWIARQSCRKRSCLCKACVAYCQCADCQEQQKKALKNCFEFERREDDVKTN